MKTSLRETAAPANSSITKLLDGADFVDAWCIEADGISLSALDHYLDAVKHTPHWIEVCMTLRNRIAALVGLKNLGNLSTLSSTKVASAYQGGDRVGIFTLFENTFDEALLGDKDKHLNVYVSVHRQRAAEAGRVVVTVTTVVHIKNLLGRIYMLPVKPMHRLIAPAILRAIEAAPIAT